VNPAVPVVVKSTTDTALPTVKIIPNTQRAQIGLGLRHTVDLPTALRRTLEWYRQKP
jgi:hypothetical protein